MKQVIPKLSQTCRGKQFQRTKQLTIRQVFAMNRDVHATIHDKNLTNHDAICFQRSLYIYRRLFLCWEIQLKRSLSYSYATCVNCRRPHTCNSHTETIRPTSHVHCVCITSASSCYNIHYHCSHYCVGENSAVVSSVVNTTVHALPWSLL